jgi:hypothetical protein
MSGSLLSIQKLSQSDKFPAYMVVSTAPYNVEDAPLQIPGPKPGELLPKPEFYIDEIAQHLKHHRGTAEILIVIHGYNTSLSGVKKWFDSIQDHIARHYRHRPGFILIGYRWPSEQIIASDLPSSPPSSIKSLQDKWRASKTVLPFILGKVSTLGTLGLLVGVTGSGLSLLAVFLDLTGAFTSLVAFLIIVIASLIATAPIVTVLLLRLVGYFRDSYRATYYGVPDLVELIRQIDARVIALEAIHNKGEAELTKDELLKKVDEEKAEWNNKRVKLSFLGHSMGGFVVTNTIRILSDVFALDSIGTLDATNPYKDPSPDIGNVFRLSRLVLVSPDIPAETIISGRANFLKSSLRRFEEAYLFSNEGDMALRLASTAANYFSFPTRTQDGGYRLGNVTVRSAPPGLGKKDNRETAIDYGLIVRLPNELLVKVQGQPIDPIDKPAERFFGLLLGAQLATVQDGQLTNLKGVPLEVCQGGELIWPQEGELKSVQEGQIVRLKTGQVVSLETQEYNNKILWCFVKIQENDLCRIQDRSPSDDLFILKDGQFVKLELGRIGKIQNGTITTVLEGQTIRDSYGKVFKVEKGQLYEYNKGLLSELHEPLRFVRDNQLVTFRSGQFERLQPIDENGKRLENPQPIDIGNKVALLSRFPLDYLYIRNKVALSLRQATIALAPNEKPLGESFTFFDFTDYVEPGSKGKKFGLLSHAKNKKALNFFDYFILTVDYFLGKIDTHGGYFYNYDSDNPKKPDAAFSKLVIYGIACLGFEAFLEQLDSHQELFEEVQDFYMHILSDLAAEYPQLSEDKRKMLALTQAFSSLCQKKQIQAMISKKCYTENILKMQDHSANQNC